MSLSIYLQLVNSLQMCEKSSVGIIDEFASVSLAVLLFNIDNMNFTGTMHETHENRASDISSGHLLQFTIEPKSLVPVQVASADPRCSDMHEIHSTASDSVMDGTHSFIFSSILHELGCFGAHSGIGGIL